MRLSRRVERLKPYPFARQAAVIRELRAKGVDVIRLDIGSPDLPPAPHILRAMDAAIHDPDRHGYPPMSGTPSFLTSVAGYYQRRFGVSLDPDTELTALIGSKEGIFHLIQAVIDEGDVALIPDPGYPAYRIAVEWAGGEAYPLPLRRERRYLPDFTAIPSSVLRRARMLWINYPNNPTAATAEPAFYEEAVAFARRHDLLLCHDAAYCDVSYEGFRPTSVLQVPGAKEVAVEFASFSKTYNMAGWRIGTLAGNARVVGALRTVKSNVDSGIFAALLDAGEAALNGPQEWLEERNSVYADRRDRILASLRASGLQAETPTASLYIWSPIPSGTTSESYAAGLLTDTGVCVAPGTFFGAEGEGFIRIALGAPTERIDEAMRRFDAWKPAPG